MLNKTEFQAVTDNGGQIQMEYDAPLSVSPREEQDALAQAERRRAIPNPSKFFPSQKADPTLGGKIDPNDYIDDFEAKMMFNATKADVDIARAGGPAIGSLAQRILGSSGGIDENGGYLSDPANADPNKSLRNAIKSGKYSFAQIYNEVMPAIAHNTENVKGNLKAYAHEIQGIQSDTMQAMVDAAKRDEKLNKSYEYYIKMGIGAYHAKVLTDLEVDGGGLEKATTSDQFVAIEKIKIAKEQKRDDAKNKDPATLMMDKVEANVFKVAKDWPLSRVISTPVEKLPQMFKAGLDADGMIMPDDITNADNYRTKVVKGTIDAQLAELESLSMINPELAKTYGKVAEEVKSRARKLWGIDYYKKPIDVKAEEKTPVDVNKKTWGKTLKDATLSSIDMQVDPYHTFQTDAFDPAQSIKQPETKIINGKTYAKIGDNKWQRQ